MLAGIHTGQGLRGMHLRGRAQNHRVYFADGQAVGKFSADMWDAVLVGYFPRLAQLTANE
jgi:hypothetical protein